MADQNNTPNLEEEELESTILLTDEEGNESAYDIADYIDVDDQEYVVLVPQDEDDDEVVILRDGVYIDTLRGSEINPDNMRQKMIGRELEGSYYRADHEFEDEYEFTDAE